MIVDPFAQARGIEYGERLSSGQRGVFAPARLLDMATAESHAAIGSPGGALAVGAPADLVAIRTDSARTAGADPGQLVMSRLGGRRADRGDRGCGSGAVGEPCDVRGSGTAAGRRDRAGLAVTDGTCSEARGVPRSMWQELTSPSR